MLLLSMELIKLQMVMDLFIYPGILVTWCRYKPECETLGLPSMEDSVFPLMSINDMIINTLAPSLNQIVSDPPRAVSLPSTSYLNIHPLFSTLHYLLA